VFGGTLDGPIQRVHQDKVRNYLAGGYTDLTNANIQSFFTVSADGTTRCKFIDASSFVLGFSVAKSDTMPFTTGIDASQSGSVQLNLYFQGTGADADPANQFSASGRRFDVHIFARCDAVVTLQESANLVRY
jgi:hypothetical protein